MGELHVLKGTGNTVPAPELNFGSVIHEGIKQVLPSALIPVVAILLSYVVIVPVYYNLGQQPSGLLQEVFGCFAGASVCFSLAEMFIEAIMDIINTSMWKMDQDTPFRETILLSSTLVAGFFFDFVGGFYSLLLTLKDKPAGWVPIAVFIVSLICLFTTILFMGAATYSQGMLEAPQASSNEIGSHNTRKRRH